MTFFKNPSGPPIKIEFTFENGKCVRTHLSHSKVFEASLQGTLKNQDKLTQWLTDYVKGEKNNPFPFPLDDSHFGPFQKSVQKALIAIPFGSFATYTDISVNIGNPRGARAVGNACGSNPFPLIVPCHRIVRKGGNLGGFAFGLEMKNALLDFEEKALKRN